MNYHSSTQFYLISSTLGSKDLVPLLELLGNSFYSLRYAKIFEKNLKQVIGKALGRVA